MFTVWVAYNQPHVYRFSPRKTFVPLGRNLVMCYRICTLNGVTWNLWLHWPCPSHKISLPSRQSKWSVEAWRIPYTNFSPKICDITEWIGKQWLQSDDISQGFSVWVTRVMFTIEKQNQFRKKQIGAECEGNFPKRISIKFSTNSMRFWQYEWPKCSDEIVF